MKKVVHQVVFLNLPILVYLSGVDATNRFSEPKVYTSTVLFVNGKAIGSLLLVNKKNRKGAQA